MRVLRTNCRPEAACLHGFRSGKRSHSGASPLPHRPALSLSRRLPLGPLSRWRFHRNHSTLGLGNPPSSLRPFLCGNNHERNHRERLEQSPKHKLGRGRNRTIGLQHHQRRSERTACRPGRQRACPLGTERKYRARGSSVFSTLGFAFTRRPPPSHLRVEHQQQHVALGKLLRDSIGTWESVALRVSQTNFLFLTTRPSTHTTPCL